MTANKALRPSPSEVAAYLESLGIVPCADLITMGAPAYFPRKGDTPQTILADHRRLHPGHDPLYYAVYGDLILMEAIQ